MSKRWGRLLLALAVGSILFVPDAGPLGTSRPALAEVVHAPDSATALAAARRQKSAVVVTGQTTEDRLVKAEPDGTMSALLTTRPVRVFRGDHWVDVDTTLVRRPDGSVAPRAVTVDLVFSGGGSAPLVSIGTGGGVLALTWPHALPAPKLSGSTATYPAVLPGVDLVLRAEANGYVKHFVVRDAAAARNPALAKLRLGVRAKGLTMKATATGATEVRDGKGKLVLAGPPSIMWDAAKPGATGPAENARRAAVQVLLAKDTVTLVPDQALLRDPKTRFPVVIDPGEQTPGRSAWAKVFSGYAEDEYWLGGRDGGEAKVGRCPASMDSTCNRVEVARTLYRFDTRFARGRIIIKSRFNTVAIRGPQCDDRHQTLVATATNFDENTNWNNKPEGWAVANAPVPGCGRNAVGFEFFGSINGDGDSVFYLVGDEGAGREAELGWRKYDPNETSLWVRYNAKPDFPETVGTDPPLPKPCTWCEGKSYVRSESIRMVAQLHDADGDQLRAKWNVYDSAGQNEEHHQDGWLGSGSWFSRDIDLRHRNGLQVAWWMAVTDGTHEAGWKEGTKPFMVDRTAPAVGPGVSSALYPADNRWHGGVGVPGTFTFSPDGDADPKNDTKDIDHYRYGWTDQPTDKVDADALGGSATVTLDVTVDGPRDLYVQSVDRGGNPSPTTKHHFYVRAGNGPLAQWSLEGNARDTAFLGGRDATVSGGAKYTPAAVGSGITLDGTSGHLTAPHTVRTDASFTVSAWVKLDRVDGSSYSVVNQEGERICAFCLMYEGSSKRWVFVMPQSDGDSPTGYDFVKSKAAPVPGVWTHLAGSYNAAEKKLRLHVNGVPAGSTPRTKSWDVGGKLRIGNARNRDAVGSHFAGGIDEVKIHDRALSDLEIRAEINRDDVKLGHWKFDETKGDTAANSVDGGVSAVLHGGARFVEAGKANGAVQLDGPNDFASTGSSVLRTDQSFSVGAWVRLDKALGANQAATAVAQNGAVNSGFMLGYRNVDGGRWEFQLPSADAVSRPTDSMVRSAPATAEPGELTHVMAVYDAGADEIRIYVNGGTPSRAPRTAGFDATGPLMVGRGLWNGQVANHWTGPVDELRAYSRAVSDEEIQGIVSSHGVTAGSWSLDGNLLDSSTKPKHGTGTGSPEYTGGQANLPDPADLAVRLNGSTNYVSADHAIDTARSFSVAAWARVDKAGGPATVVSQDGARTSTFQLRATAEKKWEFATFGAADTDGGGTHYRVSGAAVQVGVWTHLVGVYDAGSRKLLLYVNGVLAGTLADGAGFDNSTGKLQIGAARWDGARREYFPGAIDDVSVYARPLFAAEIRAMSGRDLTLVHHWAMDEAGGRTTADSVGTRAGTLAGDAAFTPGRVGNAVKFDGAGDAVTTEALDLRTDQAFTVSSWVRLGSKNCDLNVRDECKTVAVSAAADSTNKFRLGHVIDSNDNQNGAWIFELPEVDGMVTKAAVATEANEVGRWVHLTGTYDPATKSVWLYVDAVRRGEGTLLDPWPASGGLSMGQGTVEGQPADFWHGDVDDVRLYTGVLTKDRVTALKRSYPTEEGTNTLPTADAGHWKFDEGTGTTVADSSAHGRTATLKGDTGWTGGRAGYGAWLDGTSGYAETAGPVVDTTQSFSAAAWVYLTKQDTVDRTVLGQDGDRVSTFTVQYHAATKKWAVVLPTTDRDEPANPAVLYSTEPAALNDWTHLAITYEATPGSNTHKQLRLYVNGVLSGAQVGLTVLPSKGPLSIGRAKRNGVNVGHFPRGIDDVRLYGRALTGGEVRRVHDEVDTVNHGFYRFDDKTTRDFSWRKNDATASGGVTFGDGASGQAAQLDGTGSATAKAFGVSMRDSFTVSAWAKLTSKNQVATIASQDGDRMSGFVLQYRPGLNRWVFGQAGGDSDATPMVYAHSLLPPVLNQWTHVTGVYDYAGRELRIYVDGTLVGTRANVTLWTVMGKLVLGRAKENGEPTGHFTGSVDEVHVKFGAADDAEIAAEASWPKPPAGQLGRFVNDAGDRYTGRTDEPIRAGYRFQGVLGRPAAPGPNTKALYACRYGTDSFTSADPACEGQTRTGEVGLVYATQPANLATVPVYRCYTGTDHFESRQVGCESATREGILGYAAAYAALTRYRLSGHDHLSTVDGTPPSYVAEGPQGYLGLAEEAGTAPLFSCVDSGDHFLSTDAACEGKQVIGSIGRVWTQAPDGKPSKPIYRCLFGGQRFASLAANCEGQTLDKQLGHVLTAVPTTTAEFSA